MELTKEELLTLAKKEEISVSGFKERIKSGRIIIVRNPKGAPLAIGEGCFIKVNANIGTSPQQTNIKEELAKLKSAEKAGADTIMDLSTGGDLKEIRRRIIAETDLPVGSVPLYSAAVETTRKYGDVRKMSEQTLWEKIEEEASGGISFITVHTGVSEKIVRRFQKGRRLINIVSRGGSIIACWILANRKENPLLADFGRLLKIARKYRLTLSLGDGLRPGAIADSTDSFQLEELFTLGRQAEKARKSGVPVLIEGPGHIPLHQVEMNVKLAKQVCGGAPLYLLGPLVTDVAPGYDHITSAIGGAVAGMAGADFLCYVTPSEHLSLPSPEEVAEGVYASRIAGHAADLARGKKKAHQWDRSFSLARKARDWKTQKRMALNPDKMLKVHRKDEDYCTMCGEYCALRFSEQLS